MIVMLSWMRDLPVDLDPGAPPSVQIRGKPATDPLNRGISQHKGIEDENQDEDEAGIVDEELSSREGSAAVDELLELVFQLSIAFITK
jgi:hypothetical protein